MKLEGIVKEIGEIRWFDSQKNGRTAAREIVMESEGRFPETAVVQVTGADAERWAYAVGEKITVHFSFWANKHNDRWFNKLQAWIIER